MTIFALAFYTKANTKVKSNTMIGLRDGWKIYVGIAPWYCGEGEDWHDGLYHIKEGLPALPSRGDFFRPSTAAYNAMEAVFGEQPCKDCPDKNGGCMCHNYGRSPILQTSDCNHVMDVCFFQEEKEIIIILTCEVGEPVVSVSKESDTNLKLRLMAKVLGKS